MQLRWLRNEDGHWLNRLMWFDRKLLWRVDFALETRKAEILVVAAGIPKAVTADMVTPGAVVIDVGTNKGPDGKLVGDVDFDQVSKVAAAITPVPGGVGPMTVAMLIANVATAAERAADRTADRTSP